MLLSKYVYYVSVVLITTFLMMGTSSGFTLPSSLSKPFNINVASNSWNNRIPLSNSNDDKCGRPGPGSGERSGTRRRLLGSSGPPSGLSPFTLSMSTSNNYDNNNWTTSTSSKPTRDMNILTKWAIENKFNLSPSIQLSNNNNNNNNNDADESNYGVTFTQESFYDSSRTRNGSTILSVPKSFVFDSKEIFHQWKNEEETETTTTTNSSQKRKTKLELIKPAIDYIHQNGNFNIYTNHFILLIKLYQEYKKGQKSKWYEWIQSLPPSNLDFKTGVNMDDIEISCLPPFALALANHEKDKLDLFYEAFELIPRAFWDHLHDDNYGMNDNDDDKQEAFKWIFNVVHTRCWSYEDEGDDQSRPIIVPLGDMFNHKEPANVFVQDSSTSSVVEFIYSSDMGTDDDGINTIRTEENNNGLYLSYGLKNPHRFLIIFGFCDTTMPEIFSQLIFSNPSKEMISMGCNDRAEMVYRTEDGSISNAIWDCVLYTLLNQVPEEQAEFFKAYSTKDYATLKHFHEKYLLEAALTLRPHVMNNIVEQKQLLGRIDGIVEMVESSGQYISEVHPRLLMIRQHNQFLCNVFEMVRQQLDKIGDVEVKKRRERQVDPYQRVSSMNGSRGYPN